MWELLTEKDRMAQKESTLSIIILMIPNWPLVSAAHLNPFDFDSPRFCGLVKGHLKSQTIWGFGLKIQNFKTFIFATFKNFLQKNRNSSLLQEPACHARCSPSLTRYRPDFLFPKHSWIVGQHYDGFQTNSPQCGCCQEPCALTVVIHVGYTWCGVVHL